MKMTHQHFKKTSISSTGFLTRLTWRVSLVEQELLTLPEHLSSPPVSGGFVLLVFSFVCMFSRSLFVLFPLAIVLSVLLRYTDSDRIIIDKWYSIDGKTRWIQNWLEDRQQTVVLDGVSSEAVSVDWCTPGLSIRTRTSHELQSSLVYRLSLYQGFTWGTTYKQDYCVLHVKPWYRDNL
jgi:hypothetical protein